MIQKLEIFWGTVSMLFLGFGNVSVAQNNSIGLDRHETVRAKAIEQAGVAKKIRINGGNRDWRTIPVFHDCIENDCTDRSRDLVSTAIAPLNDRILVLLNTRGAPTKDANTFWIDFDLTGTRAADFQIGFSSAEENTFWIYEEGKPAKQTTIKGVNYKIKSHLTAEIPIAAVKRAYASVGVEFPADAMSRGWVRIIPHSSKNNLTTDLGPSAASPVLDRTEFFDDPISAARDKTKWGRSIPMPLRTKKWYVAQGAFGVWTHQTLNAYDLHIVDSTMEPASELKSKSNRNYYCWEEEIITPTKARVIRSQGDMADNDPFDDTRHGVANSVYLDIGGNSALQLLHCRQNSVTVEAGEILEAGTVVGKVGNSASFAYAHLHFDIWKLPLGKQSIPVALENVRVSLNSTVDCPWTREFPFWVIEEGFFVQQQPETDDACEAASTNRRSND